jgi:flagellar motor switch/type III secretory pathway protein FliN
MEALFDAKGRLEVVYGRGWISAWEAARLSKGTVVMSDTEAGDAAELLFEDRWLARGEVVIVGDRPGIPLWGFRVSGLDREAREAPERERGEGLAEILPFELVLGEAAPYSLGELGKASAGSVISFDSRFETAMPVLLRIGGREAGRGRPAVVGERLAVLLDEVAQAGSINAEVLGTGTVLEPSRAGDPAEEGSRVKLYDFRKPDRFTRRVIEALRSIHTTFADSLAARNQALAGFRVSCVDQMTWGEWLAEGKGADRAGRRLWRTAMGRPGRAYERQALPFRTGVPLLQPSAPRHPLSAELSAHIERWSAEQESMLGDRACFLAARGLLAADAGPAAGEAREGSGRDGVADLMAGLRAAWKLIGDTSFSQPEEFVGPPVMRFKAAPDHGIEGDQRGLLEDEMIALVVLEGPAGRLDIIYAARALYPLTKALDSYARFAPLS